MKVAVIIVNYNDVEDTEKYVNTITKYECINRIVVVDNQSTIIGTFETFIIFTFHLLSFNFYFLIWYIFYMHSVIFKFIIPYRF